VVKFLSASERTAAERGVAATRANPYDQQPLRLHNAGVECDRYIETISSCPGHYQGRGIVICGGGVRYFTNAWVCINMLRRLGCRLPIQLRYMGQREMSGPMAALVKPLGVECIDALKVRRRFPVRRLVGWELKPYAILHSPFREVLFLDADNVPVVNPEFLFDSPEFKTTGAIFWPDYEPESRAKARPIWRSCGLRQPAEPEFESGQIVVDKQRCWQALRLSLWFNEHSDFYYRHLHGDKETFHLAFRKLKKSYALVDKPIHPLEATMCQHDFSGRRIFQHRNLDKWDLFLHNRRIKDFWFEEECRALVAELSQMWNGRIETRWAARSRPASRAVRNVKPLRIKAIMITGGQPDGLRKQTLENLARTDWPEAPLLVRDSSPLRGEEAQLASSELRESLRCGIDHFLFFEDALDFNRHLYHNLSCWPPLRAGRVTWAGLYNPGVRELACELDSNARVVASESVFGRRVMLVSRDRVGRLVRNWSRMGNGLGLGIAHWFGRSANPILYHAPSLAQQLSGFDAEGQRLHPAMDFHPTWRA